MIRSAPVRITIVLTERGAVVTTEGDSVEDGRSPGYVPIWGPVSVVRRGNTLHRHREPVWATDDDGELIVDGAGDPIQATRRVDGAGPIISVPGWTNVDEVTTNDLPEFIARLCGPVMVHVPIARPWDGLSFQTLRDYAGAVGVAGDTREELLTNLAGSNADLFPPIPTETTRPDWWDMEWDELRTFAGSLGVHGRSREQIRSGLMDLQLWDDDASHPRTGEEE